jgi:hypothetical protein
MSEVLEILTHSPALHPRQKILALEAELARLPSIEPFVTLNEFFAPGQYAREFKLAARPWGDDRQAVVIGKIHRHAHVNVVSKGRCTVYTEDGLMEVQAPMTFISAPGTKRVVVIHEDLVWTTVHHNPTDETDLARLEAEIIAVDYNTLELLP